VNARHVARFPSVVVPIATKQRKPPMNPLFRSYASWLSSSPAGAADKMTDYLQCSGKPWNHKRIRRAYRAMALQSKAKSQKKRLPARVARTPVAPTAKPDWSLDFMSDSLSNGRTRSLNVIDDYKLRSSLWIEVDTLPPSRTRVRSVLEQLLNCEANQPHIRMWIMVPSWILPATGELGTRASIEPLHIQPGNQPKMLTLSASTAPTEKKF